MRFNLNNSPKSVIIVLLSSSLFISLLIPILLLLSKPYEPPFVPQYEPETITRQYEFIPFSAPLRNAQNETLLGLGVLNFMDSTSDGNTLITASAYGIFAWDLSKSKTSPIVWASVEDDSIQSLTLSPHGNKLAAGMDSGTVVVWNARSWKQTLALKPYVSSIHSLAFSNDETILAAVCSAGMVKLIDLQTNKLIKTLRVHNKVAISSVEFTSDGSQILLSCNHSAQSYLLDVKSGDIARTYYHNGYRNSFAKLMPDGQNVILGDNDYSFRILDKDREETALDFISDGSFTGHKREIRCLSVSPNGKTIVTSSVDGTTKFWDVDGNTEIASIGSFSPEIVNKPNQWDEYQSFFYVRFLEDNNNVLLGNRDGTIHKYDVSSQKTTLIKTGHIPAISTVALSSGKVSLFQGEFDGSIRKYNTISGELERIYQESAYHIKDIAVSSDNSKLASVDREGIVLVRDIKTGKTLYSIQPAYRNEGGERKREDWFGSVAFTPDGKRLAAGDTYIESNDDGYYNEIKWFDATNGEYVKTWSRRNNLITPRFSRETSRCQINALFTPDTSKIMITFARKSLIWDVQREAEKPDYTFGSGDGTPSIFSPDGEFVVLCGVKLEIWNVKTGQKTVTLANIKSGYHYLDNCADFSSNGKWLVSGDSTGEINVWNIAEQKSVLTWKYPKQHFQLVRFTPDQTKILIAAYNGVRIRELPKNVNIK